MPKRRHAPSQLSLRFPATWGGCRVGAGRKVGGRRTVAHRVRPEHRARFPLHVTLRARDGLPPFREEVLGRVIVRAIRTASRDAFRVVQFSVQRNHLHLIVEAHDRTALSRGMQGLGIRVARSIHRALGIRGRVFRERYHARALESPRAMRNALVYVLMNARKHGSRIANGVDALSSAPWFDGFAHHRIAHGDRTRDPPVRSARTWLAAVGWRRRGLIRLDERPVSPA